MEPPSQRSSAPTAAFALDGRERTIFVRRRAGRSFAAPSLSVRLGQRCRVGQPLRRHTEFQNRRPVRASSSGMHGASRRASSYHIDALGSAACQSLRQSRWRRSSKNMVHGARRDTGRPHTKSDEVDGSCRADVTRESHLVDVPESAGEAVGKSVTKQVQGRILSSLAKGL